ncbi:unnamed protein product [Amaranthus hypochondriacus]
MVLMQALTMFKPSSMVSCPKVLIFQNHQPKNHISISPPPSSVANQCLLFPSTPRRRSSISARPPCYDYLSNVNSYDMTGVSEIQLKVRDYELDRYGVVNNAVYCSYCHLASYELARDIGLDDNAIQSTGGIAFSKLSLTFISPLKSEDEFVVKSVISDVSAARLFADHFIFKLPNYEPIVEAKSVIVLLDKNNRPARIPAAVKSKVKQFISNENSAIKIFTGLSNLD